MGTEKGKNDNKKGKYYFQQNITKQYFQALPVQQLGF